MHSKWVVPYNRIILGLVICLGLEGIYAATQVDLTSQVKGVLPRESLTQERIARLMTGRSEAGAAA